MVYPYLKIRVMNAFSKLESISSEMTHNSYYDELEDFYKAYFEFIKQMVIKLESLNSVNQILETMVKS
jgi:hypothetical protein